MAKKTALTCKPCGYMVLVSDQGDAVIECFECGTEMILKEKRPAAKKTKKAAPRKAVAKKPAARKTAPKKKK